MKLDYLDSDDFLKTRFNGVQLDFATTNILHDVAIKTNEPNPFEGAGSSRSATARTDNTNLMGGQ